MYVNKQYQQYYAILSSEIPDFLYEYLDIPELKRISQIGLNCGTDYTNLFHNRCFYSRLDHSIGTALIIWKFTHDKKQAAAGLLHDIAAPCFSHCIDYLHQDYMKQEVTEEKTKDIIFSSKRLLQQLEKDGLSAEDVFDYKKYPIADNPSPQLSADRLEYTLSGGIVFSHAWCLADIQKIYSDITVLTNEHGCPELGFQTVEIAETFVAGASKMWYLFQGNKDKLVMQFLADMVQALMRHQRISEDELYQLSEKEVIAKMRHCGISRLEQAFANFQNADFICEGNEKPNHQYAVHISTKNRYINPLVNGVRVIDISKKAAKVIHDFTAFQAPAYGWFDFPLQEDVFL